MCEKLLNRFSALIKIKLSSGIISILGFILLSCSSIQKVTKSEQVFESQPEPTNLVTTSYYSRSLAGHLTANGEAYDPKKLTCAHRQLPFGTVLKVKNPKNSKEVLVRINDRGPFIRGRELDISNAAAEQLGISGVQPVEMQIVSN